MLAYNQNNDNMNGGTRYDNGGQIYKSMQLLWYHFQPRPTLGFSALFLNTGLQDIDTTVNRTLYQQVIGGYVKFAPRTLTLEGSFYYQCGHDDYDLPLHAWTAAIESNWKPTPKWNLNTGYFYLSGDKYYFVPPKGSLGLALLKETRSFNLLFGSRHQFYGAMDFFYLSSFYGGRSPGMQDFHVGGDFTPNDKFTFSAKYHAVAATVNVDGKGRFLGNEIELSAEYMPIKEIDIAAGFTYMKGTEVLKIARRDFDDNHSHWLWIKLVVTPKFFTYNW